MGELVARPANAVNDKIIAMADSHSAEEISKALGGTISAKKIASYTQTLLASKNWLTLAQEDRINTLKMQRLLLELDTQFRDNDNMALQLKFLKEIAARLDKRAQATQTDLTALYGNQAIIMGQAIELALTKALRMLQDVHPELEESEVREAMQLSLPLAMAEIDARTSDE